MMVPEAGIEPARISPGDFESPASTNFTTRAGSKTKSIMTRAQARALLQAGLVALAEPLKLGGTLSSILKKFLCLYADSDDKTSD